MDRQDLLIVIFLVVYMVVLLKMLPFVLVSLAYNRGRVVNIGGLVIYNIFSIFNFVVFWGCVFLLCYCKRIECAEEPRALQKDCYLRVFSSVRHLECRDQFPRALQFLGHGYAAIPLVLTYVIMLLEAVILKRYLIVSIHGNRIPAIADLSKEQAVDLIKEKMEEQPYVTWTITCGHDVRCCGCSYYKKTCADTRTYSFNNTKNWKANSPQGALPTIGSFGALFTHLSIQVSVSPADGPTQTQLSRERADFERDHASHDDQVAMTTESHVIHNYLVLDTGLWILYWILAVLGLSVLYRTFIILIQGHLTYPITKHVYSGDESELQQHSGCSNGGENKTSTL